MRLATTRARIRTRAWRAIPGLGLVAGALTACTVPNFEGPQVQNPPQGFLLTPESYQQRRLFPQRELVFHSAWVETLQDFSTIYIDGYAGVLGLEDAMAARDSVRRYAIDRDATFGEVEAISVDGRQGFGWAERVESPSRGLVSVAYRAVVPYDTVTYTVEVYSGDPALKRVAPDTLKAIIQDFAIGRTTYNLPLIALIIGGAVAAAAFLRSKQQERGARLRSINLVKIPKKKAEEKTEAKSEVKVEEKAVAEARPFPDWRGPSKAAQPKAPPPPGSESA